ncbi:MAG: grasp-with-spasm system SPASM domain peptide maturase [Saprospiraceae bacterium]
MNRKKYLRLYSNCFIVKGIYRSIICDSQRSKYVFIPNSLYDLFLNNSYINLISLNKNLDFDDFKILNEYIDLLEKHELVFYSDTKKELKFFPKINLEWDFPAKITNCLIDLMTTEINISFILEQLESIGCRYIQFRCFDNIQISYFKSISKKILESNIISSEIILNYSYENIQDSILLLNENKKIYSILLYSSPDNKILYNEGDIGVGTLISTKQKFKNINQCGNNHPILFSPNIEFFSEAHHHNTCLNRKISIDADGNIRNCPSMPQSFGNIKDTTLLEALDHPDFKKYWNHKKDDIEVCRDCEFRYICTDCRAYLEDPQNEYSKPLKCGYDPYTGEWSEWSTNPLKEAAIKYYGMEELVKQ